MKKTFAAVLVLLIAIVFWGCEKANEVSITAPVSENLYPPEIIGFTVSPMYPQPEETVLINCIVIDPDFSGDPYFYLNCLWNSDYGDLNPGGMSEAHWRIEYPGDFYVYCTVSDNIYSVTDSVLISVGAPPMPPSNPYPANQAENVPAAVILTWDCTDLEGDSIYYNVSFGLENSWGGYDDIANVYNLTTPSFNPGLLSDSTRYYWEVEARDQYGHFSDSSFWIFITAP